MQIPKPAIFLSCFGDYSDFSYFLPGLSRKFCWVLGAVLAIFAVSATFSQVFSGCWAGFWVLFQRFLQFQLLFPGSFPALGLDFGCCFRNFCSFSYFFTDFFQLLVWILGAVLGISAVSATFSQIFRMLGLVLGWCQNITIRETKHAIKIWHSLINQIHLLVL